MAAKCNFGREYVKLEVGDVQHSYSKNAAYEVSPNHFCLSPGLEE
jgi:hypothetical protein